MAKRDPREFSKALRKAERMPLAEAGRSKAALVFFLRALSTDHRRVPQPRIDRLRRRLERDPKGPLQLTPRERMDLVWLLTDRERLRSVDTMSNVDDGGAPYPLGKGCPRCDAVLVQDFLHLLGVVEGHLVLQRHDAEAAGAPAPITDPIEEKRLVRDAALFMFAERWKFKTEKTARNWLLKRRTRHPDLAREWPDVPHGPRPRR